MGQRKQKLKRERRAANLKKEQELAATAAAAAASASAVTTNSMICAPVGMNLNEHGCDCGCTGGVHMKIPDDTDVLFPKSDLWIQGNQLLEDDAVTNHGTIHNCFMRGAIEYGCIHSILMIATSLSNPIQGGRYIHIAQIWFIEGAVRGNSSCALTLATGRSPYGRYSPLRAYWMKINNKYYAWSGDEYAGTKHNWQLKDVIERACAVCRKEDTETLTLQQCVGCRMHCYCTPECQQIHWDEQHHRNECKQIQILNKYHKPYAKEIRAAVIRGETNIPALEKLRYKLGLSRPMEEYDELCNNNTHNGTPIDPSEYVVGREDGTVWIGSFPNEPIEEETSSTTGTDPTCTTTIDTDTDTDIPLTCSVSFFGKR